MAVEELFGDKSCMAATTSGAKTSQKKSAAGVHEFFILFNYNFDRLQKRVSNESIC
jgi:hypothetical protein